jgi:16S rRNA processing protein RimM
MKDVLVNQTPMEVERTWRHGDQVIFKFKGVDTISDAERLAGADVSIPIERRAPVPEGEYYQSDLLGCEVFDPTGRHLGTVEAWQETAGTPLLEVRTPDQKEMLIPFAKSICTKIDPEQHRIEVTLPEGLEDLN